jgi:hypothetical protein
LNPSVKLIWCPVRFSVGYATFTFDQFEVPRVVVGDVNKDSQNVPSPSIDKTVEGDTKLLEFGVAIGRPNEVQARCVEHTINASKPFLIGYQHLQDQCNCETSCQRKKYEKCFLV